ncbi:SseB family protein [Kocuria sp. LUK]|uniref:SseB family protein n=1 Tax=Kocuria sp. LUK TaxID=2897828 RepID=UPI001E3B0B93|nr:SseB family protein [Kocuria sp. LUK]MCD1145130.1 SseB family protein [Kocuria sp. LUK]
MTQRPLPEHIAAQLRGAGGTADTAGQAWAGRNLGEGTSHTHRFPDDDGAAAPAVLAALAALRTGEGDESAVVAALAGARLFVPVVAEVSSSTRTEDGLVADKEADMALVTLRAADGRQVLPTFTSTEALTAWHAGARPVATDARRAAVAAVKDGTQLLVLDPGSAAPFVVRRPALWALAQGREWVPSYRSAEVAQAVQRAAAGLPGVVSASTAPGDGVAARAADGAAVPGGGTGPELAVVLALRAGLDRAALEDVVARLQARLSTERALAEDVDSLQVRLTAAERA